MISNGFLMTGTRCINVCEIAAMELWHTDSAARLMMESGHTVTLDEDESRVIRRWAELNMQTAAVITESLLLGARCEFLGYQLQAASLNQDAARRASRAKKAAKKKAAEKNAAKVPAAVVDISVWKAARVPAAVAELAEIAA